MLDDDILWMDTILQKAFNEDSTTVMSWRRIKKALAVGQKPTTNSDYATALKVYKEYTDAKYRCEVDAPFVRWCEGRLHSGTNVA